MRTLQAMPTNQSTISYLNEYVENSKSWYANENKQYENLAYAGLICQSSKEISTFSSFSAYFSMALRLNGCHNSGNKRSTSNFPEIAYDLLTNRRYGVGEFIGNNSIDKWRLTVAAKFCRANGFYWDGVISEETNLREFMYSQAAFQLLDFEIRGGQFSLYPSVPFNSDYTIDNNAVAGLQRPDQGVVHQRQRPQLQDNIALPGRAAAVCGRGEVSKGEELRLP